MPNIRMEPIIRKSISRTKLILLETLDWKKWLKLLFIAWLAGALGGGGKGGDLSDFARLINKQQAGNNAELPQASSATYNYSAQQDTSVPAEPASEYDEQYSMEYDRDYQDSEGSSDAESVLESWQEEESPYGTEETKESDQYEEYGFKEAGSRGSPGMFIWVFIGLFTLAILIPFSWLVSRFKFIWYNAVVKNDAAIAEPFKRYHRQGNSFFVFAWIYTIILVSFWGGLVYIGYLSLKSAGALEDSFNWTFTSGMSLLGIPIIVFFISLIVSMIFYYFVEHFVVPIMAMDDIAFLPAWRKFVAIFKENTRHFLMFVFVSIVAAIICGIMATIVLILLVVFCLLVGAFIFGVGYFIFATLLNMELLFSVFAFAVGVPFAILCLILLFSVSLPFAVFFRSFSLYFLSSLECGYQPLPLEESEEEKQ